MSKETHNKDALKKLLEGGDVPAGDFEKEALEGFAMLGNEQEALDLKQSLDEEIYASVLKPAEKKTRTGTYWLAAAAGLLLLVGFSVYFIRDSNTVIKANNMAISHAAPEAEIQLAPHVPAVQERPAAPETKAPAPAAEKSTRSTAQKNAQLVQAEAAPAVPAAPLSRPVSTYAKSKKMAEPPAEEAELAKGIATDAAAPPEPAREEMAADSKDKMFVPAVEARPDSSPAIVLQNIPQNVYSASSPPIVTYKMEMPAGPGAYTFYNCTYTGGDEALKKDIGAKLAPKGLAQQQFEALLYINESKTVTKAKITKAYNLSKAQQAQVEALLMSLDKFNFSGKPAGRVMAFKVVYKP